MIRKYSTTQHQSLSNRLIAVILLCYFCIATSFTLIQLYTEFTVEKENLGHQIDSLSDTFHPILSEAIWNYDDTQLKAAIIGIYNKPEVFGISVDNTYDDIWHLGYYRQKDGSIAQNFDFDGRVETKKMIDFDYHNLYEAKIDLYQEYNGEQKKIGSLTIYFSSVTVLERTWMTFLITLSGALIKTLSLWVISIIVINKMVSKPLSNLTRDIENFPTDALSETSLTSFSTEQKQQDELFHLQKSFVNLRNELVARNIEIEERKTYLESEVEKRTESLDNAMKELERTSQIKSDFLATMSHEIRTPMNAVIGGVQILGKTNLNKKQQKLLDTISHGGKNLLVLIDNILDLSKIEANKLILESTPFDLITIMQQVVETFRPNAVSKSLDIGFKSNGQFPTLLVLGDPTRLSQVLNNLVSNAIKFTESGAVILFLEVLQQSEQEVEFNIIVQDTGIGISDVQKKTLFEAFTQADVSTTRNYGGTGLGLAICQQLVDAMGGNIEIESAPHLGSKFILRLNLPTTAKLVGPVTDEVIDYSAANILLVDDVEINREIAMMMLEDVGHQITTANNGLEALEAYQADHEKFDVILMDCLMPEMDGFECTRKIREFEINHHLQPAKIIALTASALDQSKQDCMEAGMDSFISKPFEEAELLDMIQHCATGKFRSQSLGPV